MRGLSRPATCGSRPVGLGIWVNGNRELGDEFKVTSYSEGHVIRGANNQVQH